MSGWRKKLFRVLKFIFGPLGRHFFQTSVTFRDLRILVHSFLYKEQILYKRKKVFQDLRINPQILKNFSPSLFVPDLLLSWLQTSTGVFRDLRINPQILKNSPKNTRGWVYHPIFGGKTQKKSAKFFLRLRHTHKKYILQKKWPKTVNPALSSDVSILPLTIWGCHCQLDDHHRNPNTNNRDHLVG